MVGVEMVLNIGQQSRCFITGGLDHLTVELSESRCQQLIPSGLVAGLSQLFQNNEVAHGFDSHQAEPASKGFILGEADVFGGHVLGQSGRFRFTVRSD